MSNLTTSGGMVADVMTKCKNTTAAPTEEDSDLGAVMYIIAVLTFYSLGIVVMIVKYLQTEKKEIEEELVINNFFKGIPDQRIQHEVAAVNRVAIQAFHTLTATKDMPNDTSLSESMRSSYAEHGGSRDCEEGDLQLHRKKSPDLDDDVYKERWLKPESAPSGRRNSCEASGGGDEDVSVFLTSSLDAKDENIAHYRPHSPGSDYHLPGADVLSESEDSDFYRNVGEYHLMNELDNTDIDSALSAPNSPALRADGSGKKASKSVIFCDTISAYADSPVVPSEAEQKTTGFYKRRINNDSAFPPSVVSSEARHPLVESPLESPVVPHISISCCTATDECAAAQPRSHALEHNPQSTNHKSRHWSAGSNERAKNSKPLKSVSLRGPASSKSSKEKIRFHKMYLKRGKQSPKRQSSLQDRYPPSPEKDWSDISSHNSSSSLITRIGLGDPMTPPSRARGAHRDANDELSRVNAADSAATHPEQVYLKSTSGPMHQYNTMVPRHVTASVRFADANDDEESNKKFLVTDL